MNTPSTGGVCFIIPPSVFLLDERVFVSLGILKVVAVVEKAGYKVDALDLSGIKNFNEVLQSYIETHNRTKTFAITSTTPQLPAVTQITHCIREHKSDSRIILGGPHPTLVNAAAKKERAKEVSGRALEAMQHLQEICDCIVAGDGEEAIFEALQNEDATLIDADDRRSPLFLKRGTLEEYPFPARHLVDMSSYHYSIEGFDSTSLIAQLGCPFSCGFCGGRESSMLRITRTRSSEHVVEEMVHLYKKYGYTGFMLYDDELNVNPKMIELMNLISDTQEKLGTEWRLRGFVKAELFTPEQAHAMYRAGFRWLLTGFESGSPRILKNINKRATRDDNNRCVEFARNANLKVKALMSIGHPGESRETTEDTHKWLLETAPDDFDVTIITTYPGTPYYDQAVRSTQYEGVWVYTCPSTEDRLYAYPIDYRTEADYYKGDPEGGYRSFVFTDFLEAQELVEIRDHIEKDVRAKLNIPFNPSKPAVDFEHSMGQRGPLPSSVLRSG